MKNPKPETLKTILIIVIGFMLLYWLTKLKGFFIFALVLGIAALISPFLAKKIEFLWMKLSLLMSKIIPPVILSIIFYLILCPIALLSRLIKKNSALQLKNTDKSLFKNVTKDYNKSFFERPW